MTCLACFLEELSAREMLHGVLERILPTDIEVRYVVFEGKQDMDKQLERRLRGWRRPDTVFLVMRDQDAGDCVDVKQSLAKKIKSGGRSANTCIRIACRELESFYLGDLAAVETGLEINNLARRQSQRNYANPDRLQDPSGELQRLTNHKYQKVSGSRAIAPRLRLDGGNRSHSFNALLDGIRRLTAAR